MKSFFITLFAFFSFVGFGQWQQITTPRVSQPILYTFSPDTFHLAGYNGNLYKSENGGLTYTKDSLNLFGGWFLDMEFADASVGYACGGTAFGNFASPILKTVDGGNNWDTLVTNKYGYELSCLDVIDNQTAYFGSNNFIVKTIDGGASFSVDTLGADFVYDIHFFNTTVGLALFGKQIMRTTDGGDNWSPVFTDTSNANTWRGVKMAFPNQTGTCYYVNSLGHFYKSINNGLSWSYVSTVSASYWVNDISFPTDDIGFITTSDPLEFHNKGNIMATKDGGITWASVARSDTGSFTGISMADEKNGYAITYTKVYKTSNAGGLSFGNIELDDFKIYPNPAKEFLKFEVEQENSQAIRLLNAQGKQVVNIDLNAQEVNVSYLPAGIYFLKVLYQHGLYNIERIIVE